MSEIDIPVVFVMVIVASVLGFFLAQLLSIRLARARVRRIRRKEQAHPVKSKPEPEKLEIELVVSGLDEFEAHMQHVMELIEGAVEVGQGLPGFDGEVSENDETAA